MAVHPDTETVRGLDFLCQANKRPPQSIDISQNSIKHMGILLHYPWSFILARFRYLVKSYGLVSTAGVRKKLLLFLSPLLGMLPNAKAGISLWMRQFPGTDSEVHHSARQESRSVPPPQPAAH